MYLPPSEHIVWKLLAVAILGALYIFCANVYFKNGWSEADFKTLTTQTGGLVLALFGPGWLHKTCATSTEGDDE